MRETDWLNTKRFLGKNDIAGKTEYTKRARNSLDSFYENLSLKYLYFYP